MYDDTDGENRVGGYYKQSNHLSFLIVYGAGHFVPTNQMQISRTFLRDYLENGNLQCHDKSDSKCSVDETTCNLMNNCNGNGECKNGRCTCSEGYFGADCSVVPGQVKPGKSFLTDSDTTTFELGAQTWTYF